MDKKTNIFDSWLDRVRNTTPAVQRLWLYAMTLPTMAAVILLWSDYASLQTPSVLPPVSGKIALGTTGANTTPEADKAIDVKAGLALVARAMGVGVSRGVAYVKDIVKNNILGSEKTIVVKTKNKDFLIETLPPVPKQELPIAE